MEWNAVWQWLQGLAVFVLAAAASYKLWLPPLKEFILKKLDQRFEKQLQDADHAFQEKVRHVQSAIDRELDRARKLQDREFDALTKGWEVLHEAYWRAREATGRGYTIHVLATMQEEQLEEFIDNLEFAAWQKKELRHLVNDGAEHDTIQKYYTNGWRWKQYSECTKWRLKLLMHSDRKGIFIQPETKQRFDTLHQLISGALLELELRIKDIDVPVNRYHEFIRSDALRDSETGAYAELENMIRERIWSLVQQQ